MVVKGENSLPLRQPTPDGLPGHYYGSLGPLPEVTRPTVPTSEWVEDMVSRTDGPRMPGFVANIIAARRVLDRD